MWKILYVGLADLTQASLCVPVQDLGLQHLCMDKYVEAQEYDIVIFERGEDYKTLKHRGQLLEKRTDEQPQKGRVI